MATTAPVNVRCLNCGQDVHGAYCAACGQAAATGRLRVGTILGDALSHLTNVDSAALRTVVGLTRAPGQVCRDYVDGKRVGYVTPLRYCVTLVALKLLVNLATGFDPADLAAQGSTGLTETQETVRAVVTTYVTRHFDIVLFLMLPLFVAVVRWLFRGKGYNYAEVGVFVLYLVGHVTLLGIPLTPLKAVAPPVMIPLGMLLQVGFFAWAAMTFFNTSAVSATLKSVVATVAYYFLIVTTVTLLVMPRVLAVLEKP